MVFELAEPDLAFLLGNAPSVRDYRDLRFDDLRPLLQRIARVDASGEPDVRPVPSSKFQFNALSESVRALFMAAKPQIVGQTLSNWPDPTFGDSVAEAFRQRYQALKQSGMEPDEIFAWLQRFAGGTERQGPRGEAAIVTVLAYLFEQCDIFERPPNLDNAQ